MRSVIRGVAVLVLAAAVGCGAGGHADDLKEIISKQLYIPLQSVKVTGDTTAVGTLAGGEELAIRWKRTGDRIECICQKPKAQAEADVRSLLSQMGYTAKTVTIRPSGAGVGYVGEATDDDGVSFDVTENTDGFNLTSMMYVKVAPRSYPRCARLALEKEVGAKVTEEAAIQPNDLTPNGGVGGPVNLGFLRKESLFKGRFKAGGTWYGVELYQESSGIAGLTSPSSNKSVNMAIYYQEFP